MLRCPTLALLLPLCAGMASANVGPPSSGGQVVAEPAGLADIAIEKETLIIDLRPLATNGRATIEATYELRNNGLNRTLHLLFATGIAGDREFDVRLDDTPLTLQAAKAADVPESWKPPRSTPHPHGGAALEYLVHGQAKAIPIAFTVEIPQGMHTLKVRYTIETAKHSHGDPTIFHQMAYVLAPAKAWSRFGGLDVTVNLPPGWTVACTPEIPREGDALRGHFDAIPADAIAITLQAPAGQAYTYWTTGTKLLLGAVVMLGAVACWFAGQAVGRRAGKVSRRAMLWPQCLLIAAMFAFLVGAAGLLALYGPEMALPEGQATQYGYGHFFAIVAILALALFVLIVGFFVARIGAKAGRRRGYRDRQDDFPQSFATRARRGPL